MPDSSPKPDYKEFPSSPRAHHTMRIELERAIHVASPSVAKIRGGSGDTRCVVRRLRCPAFGLGTSRFLARNAVGGGGVIVFFDEIHKPSHVVVRFVRQYTIIISAFFIRTARLLAPSQCIRKRHRRERAGQRSFVRSCRGLCQFTGGISRLRKGCKASPGFPPLHPRKRQEGG